MHYCWCITLIWCCLKYAKKKHKWIEMNKWGKIFVLLPIQLQLDLFHDFLVTCVHSASSDLIQLLVPPLTRTHTLTHAHTQRHIQPCSLFTRELKWYWTVSNNWKSGITTSVLSQCTCVCALITCLVDCCFWLKKKEWLRVSLTPRCYLFSLPPDLCLPLSTFCRALWTHFRSQWEF